MRGEKFVTTGECKALAKIAPHYCTDIEFPLHYKDEVLKKLVDRGVPHYKICVDFDSVFISVGPTWEELDAYEAGR